MTQTRSQKLLAREPGLFGDILVGGGPRRRWMKFGDEDSVNQSLVDLQEPTRLVPAYLRCAAWGLSLAARKQKMLVIGLGGGGFVRFLRKRFPRVEIDIIEIDPTAVSLAKAHFKIRETKHTRIHVTDAVLYLLAQDDLYDFILLDAYEGARLGPRLADFEFFSLAQGHLESGGICVANICEPSAQREKRTTAAFSRAFHHNSLDVTMPRDRNRIVVGATSPLPSRAILTHSAQVADLLGYYPFRLTPFVRNIRSHRPENAVRHNKTGSNSESEKKMQPR